MGDNPEDEVISKLREEAKNKRQMDYIQRENELKRRLRADYMRAAKRLNDLVDDSDNTDARLQAFRVIGANSTRQSFLAKIITPTFQAKTLGDVLSGLRDAASIFAQHGIFDSIEVSLDKATSPLADERAIEAVFEVKEKSRFQARTGTEFGNGEGNMNGSLFVRNVFGGAETLQASMLFGTRTQSAFDVRLDSPINANPWAHVDVSAFSSLRNNSWYASHDEKVQGAAVKFRALSSLGYHELGYELADRQILNIADRASLSVRESAGHSLKSAVSHVFIRDQRDDPMLPTKGYYTKLLYEFAGLGGDVASTKTELEGQVAADLGRGFSLSASARGGLLIPLYGTDTLLSDRFQIGGPTSVRGFKMCGLGPRDGPDNIGGDMYAAGGISLFTPLPGVVNWPLKGHCFVNAGSSLPYNTNLTPADNMRTLLRNEPPSISAGFGLAYRYAVCRLELDFVVPLQARQGDQLRKGLQLGLGINFL